MRSRFRLADCSGSTSSIGHEASPASHNILATCFERGRVRTWKNERGMWMNFPHASFNDSASYLLPELPGPPGATIRVGVVRIVSASAAVTVIAAISTRQY